MTIEETRRIIEVCESMEGDERFTAVSQIVDSIVEKAVLLARRGDLNSTKCRFEELMSSQSDEIEGH